MADNSQFKILIVDDNPNNIQLLGSILNSEGYAAEFATSGPDALDWTENENFDIVLLDIMMPEMDGYEVCEKLKANPKTNHIPVIFITAKQDTDSIVKGFDIGAVDYISKPFKERELLARLGYHLELLNARRQLEKLNNELQEKNDTIMQSLLYAEKLQEAMLPSKNEITPLFKDYFVLFKPLLHLSGDFFWTKQEGEKTLFVLGDSMGHGIPGALLSILGMSSLNAIIENEEKITPASLLNKLRIKENQSFSSDAGIMHDSIDMAVCMFDNKNKTVTFSGANLPMVHLGNQQAKFVTQMPENAYVLNSAKQNLTFIPGNKNTIGRNINTRQFTDITIELQQHDTIYLFSDGYRDQFGGNKKQKYKKKRFLELLRKTNKAKLNEQSQLLEKEFKSWKGSNPQIDDVTVIGLKMF